MKIKAEMQVEYDKYVEVNSTDGYSYGIVKYAQRWAELMESEIEGGKAVREIADRTSHEADTDGITGFMYGCAVQALSHFWEYGEDLRKWHNKEYDYSGDGVVNPAVLTI